METNSQMNLNPEAPEFHPAVEEEEECDDEYIIAYDLPYSISEEEVIQFFNDNVGLVKTCCLIDRGKATVTFHDPKDARRSLTVDLTNARLLGRLVRIHLYINGCHVTQHQLTLLQSRNSLLTHVHVTNLVPSTKRRKLIKYFEEFVGPVRFASLERNEDGCVNGQVVFSDPWHAMRAVSRKNFNFNGRIIKVKHISPDPIAKRENMDKKQQDPQNVSFIDYSDSKDKSVSEPWWAMDPYDD